MNSSPAEAQPDAFDSPWKDILDGWFPDFMTFFFPDAASEIDWSRGFESLDKELAQVVQEAELGRRYADKLLKVRLADGSEEWVLVHIEVQGQPETDFPRRMFVYAYRIYDRYGCEVASFAVLADTRPGWQPSQFQIEENLKMPYMSFIERRGHAAGHAAGQVTGAGMIVREQLEERFGPLPETALARLEAADAEQLRAWARRVLDAGSLEDA